jgi:hypothetical protein
MKAARAGKTDCQDPSLRDPTEESKRARGLAELQGQEFPPKRSER